MIKRIVCPGQMTGYSVPLEAIMTSSPLSKGQGKIIYDAGEEEEVTTRSQRWHIKET